MIPALAVHGLHATVGPSEAHPGSLRPQVLLSAVDVALPAGRVLAVLGDSGAGKSTLGLAMLGEAAPGVTLRGRVEVGGVDLLAAGVRHPGAGRVSFVPQQPGAALDPVRRVGAVLDELAATVHGAGRSARARRGAAVAHALEQSRLEPDLARRFPHQLSGGQQQRVALALALVVEPAVVVLDEPTTGLDPVTTGEVVETLAALAAAGTALVVLTHDHDVAGALADDVLVLHEGAVTGHTLTEASGPASVTTAVEDADRRPDRLRVTGLRATAGGVPLVEDIDLDARAGECLAVVGRSGAGKTTLARALAGLRPADRGRVEVDGATLAPSVRHRDAAARRAVQYVHQDPRASFLEHRPVLDQVARPGVLLRGLSAADAADEAGDLLDRLGLGGDARERRPGGLSGGQLQRAALARALMARPAVLVADEVTAALDARHRVGLLAAIDRVRREDATTVVLVSHDLALVSRVADRVAVLDAGRLVEITVVDAVDMHQHQ